jgi:hypothetical protein
MFPAGFDADCPCTIAHTGGAKDYAARRPVRRRYSLLLPFQTDKARPKILAKLNDDDMDVHPVLEAAASADLGIRHDGLATSDDELGDSRTGVAAHDP